jgi:hypothetical protein
MQVPVRIRSTDAQGQTVDEETETLAINAHGALVLLQTRLVSGSRVLLFHKKTLEEQEWDRRRFVTRRAVQRNGASHAWCSKRELTICGCNRWVARRRRGR